MKREFKFKEDFVMKRVIVSVLIITMLVGFATCAGADTSKDPADLVIGISMATMQEERWGKDLQIMTNELKLLGVKEGNILVQSAQGDEMKQLNQCENLITQGIDALIVIPQNADVLAPMVKSAHEVGTFVLTVWRNINNADVDLNMCPDTFRIGVIQATALLEKCKKGNWVLIGGAPTDPSSKRIREGKLSVLQPYIDSGDINIVLDPFADYWKPSEALRYTEQALTANNNDIQVVCTTNDGCAGAAIEALEEQGLAGKVAVSGLDCDIAACRRILAGTQTMSVYMSQLPADKGIARAAVAMSLGKDVEKALGREIIITKHGNYELPTVILGDEESLCGVDNSNLEKIVEDGWQKVEDIYANIPKADWPEWTEKYIK